MDLSEHHAIDSLHVEGINTPVSGGQAEKNGLLGMGVREFLNGFPCKQLTQGSCIFFAVYCFIPLSL